MNESISPYPERSSDERLYGLLNLAFDMIPQSSKAQPIGTSGNWQLALPGGEHAIVAPDGRRALFARETTIKMPGDLEQWVRLDEMSLSVSQHAAEELKPLANIIPLVQSNTGLWPVRRLGSYCISARRDRLAYYCAVTYSGNGRPVRALGQFVVKDEAFRMSDTEVDYWTAKIRGVAA